MDSKPEWIFFDVGWTLVDETPVHLDRFAKVLAAAPGAKGETPRSLFSRYEAAVIERASDPFVRVLEAVGLTAADRGRFAYDHGRERLYRDAAPALRALRGTVRLGVLANQSDGLADRLARQGLAGRFDLILGSKDAGFSKPDPKFFELAVERAGCAPPGLVMAGDRLDNDIAPAKRAGWRTAWIRRGLHAGTRPADATETPDVEVGNLSRLAARFVSAERVRLAELVDWDGAIMAWPDKEKEKALVLDHLAARFDEGVDYAEPEVNRIIDAHHRFGDFCLLRRELVDRGLLSRDAAGRRYRRAAPAVR